MDRILDADGDGWLADVDCDNADATQGGTELLTDAVDNDCDGHAAIDLRNWPSDDSDCWLGATGSEVNTVLIRDGGYIDLSTGAEVTADQVVSGAEVEGDGIPELAYALGDTVTWSPSAGDDVSFQVQGDPSASLGWGGMVQGCPTVLVPGPHDIQPNWISIRRVDLCNGTVRQEWTFSDTDRRYEDFHVLDLGTDFWYEILLAQPYRDAPTLGIQYKVQPDAAESHEHFDVRIRGEAPPFAERVTSADMDGDNLEELLISAGDGAWLVTGNDLPGTSDIVQDRAIAELGVFLPAGPPVGLAFRDLDRDGNLEALVAVESETGLVVQGYDLDGVNTATLVAPPGSCDGSGLSNEVAISGGTAFFLP